MNSHEVTPERDEKELEEELDELDDDERAFEQSKEDRIQVLLNVSEIEESLRDVLEQSLIDGDEGTHEKFMGHYLRDFGTCIQFAYWFGLIDADERNDLDLIRKIRNHFAHKALHITFDGKRGNKTTGTRERDKTGEQIETEIANCCGNLRLYKKLPHPHKQSALPRDRFEASCKILKVSLDERDTNAREMKTSRKSLSDLKEELAEVFI